MPEWATPDALDLEVRRDLRGLSKDGADWVAAHLFAAGALADDDPETAWRHARAARARGGRIGVVRETVGLVAYRAGEWAEAIGELRAARRMGGGPGHLAVMADCERALEHPERAIELSRSAEATELDPEAALELAIVVAGARADLDQVDAALAHLERIGLDKAEEHPRLAYAYADLLLKAGRNQEALSWFIRAANVDAEEETDALERVEALSEDESIDADLAATELSEAGLVIDELVAEPSADDDAVIVQLDAGTGGAVADGHDENHPMVAEHADDEHAVDEHVGDEQAVAEHRVDEDGAGDRRTDDTELNEAEISPPERAGTPPSDGAAPEVEAGGDATDAEDDPSTTADRGAIPALTFSDDPQADDR